MLDFKFCHFKCKFFSFFAKSNINNLSIMTYIHREKLIRPTSASAMFTSCSSKTASTHGSPWHISPFLIIGVVFLVHESLSELNKENVLFCACKLSGTLLSSCIYY